MGILQKCGQSLRKLKNKSATMARAVTTPRPRGSRGEVRGAG